MYQIASSAPPNPLFPPNWIEMIVGGVAFLVVLGVLSTVLVPRIMTTLNERNDKIEGSLRRAAEAHVVADQLREHCQAQLAGARHEAARLREQSREEGAAISAEIRQRAQVEARRLAAAARAQIDADRQQAFSSLRAEIGTLSVQLASKIVGEPLEDDTSKLLS